MTRFQPFLDLPAAQFEALKRDIAEKGVLQPVVVDEDGNVLDGHQRVRACAELHVDYPVHVEEGLTEGDKRAYAISVNLRRRHLIGTERSKYIDELKRLGWSTRRIAEAVGVHHSTIVRSGGASAPPDTPTPQQGSVADGPASEGLAPSPVEATPEGEPSETAVGQRSASHRKDARPGSEVDPATEGEPGGEDQVPASSPAPRVKGKDGKSYAARKPKKAKPDPTDDEAFKSQVWTVMSAVSRDLLTVNPVRAVQVTPKADQQTLVTFAKQVQAWAVEVLTEASTRPALEAVPNAS